MSATKSCASTGSNTLKTLSLFLDQAICYALVVTKDTANNVSITKCLTQCEGAAAAYILRRLAHALNAYNPSRQERLFFDIERNGSSLEAIVGWSMAQKSTLQSMGLTISAKRTTLKTDIVLQWVAEGKGNRAAILATAAKHLHPGLDRELPHAVAIMPTSLNPSDKDKKTTATTKKLSGSKQTQTAGQIQIIDPWPDVETISQPSDALTKAHQESRYDCVLFYTPGFG